MAAIPKVQFPSGTKVDQLAYGTGSAWMKEVEGEVHRPTVDAIKDAINVGYRHLDGAQYYKNETELGLAVRESGIPRSEFFLTTKVFGHTDVEGQLRASLEKLGTDYIDLYMLHEPFSARGSPAALQAVWRDMEACHDKGLARNIGVSNFLVPHIKAVLETAKTKPAVNQIELHPYLPRAELVDFCQSQGITVEAFAPLTPLTKASPGPIDNVVQRLAAKYSITESAVLLRWHVERGIVVITTSSKKERLQEYLVQIPGFQLSEAEVDEIGKAGEQKLFRQYLADFFGKDVWD
ncbi:hypothetical protein PFICI_05848 [Pestalotiopsis fici W106-1]|uniref:NADP-dependent oxidoreductase domain-containing protein n=1 Tax=Pestalotiopsis fici (strain W106-1 / CGMCC3.15140) TaxID=1229662 RepID=W3XEX2_PESFW|nr:uncharacterized protein PFICI_05848 [Pestalotiopsis fici W106-1]ETS83972.1 hypothetical protein PFICI_05848 [Pestalotiopsis fici W106-1]